MSVTQDKRVENAEIERRLGLEDGWIVAGMEPKEMMMTMSGGQSLFHQAVRLMTKCSLRATIQAAIDLS